MAHMKDPVRERMLGLAAYVLAAEAQADRLAPTIDRHRDRGDAARADALTRLARNYRIRAPEARANLCALAGHEQATPLA